MTPSNVLFLFSDEHDPRYMGCSGHPFVQTPNLDAIAARGTRFANAWTPCPVCVPARASLATGRWVHDIGHWDNALGYDGRIPGWGHRLQAEGRRVESIGKLHYRNGTDPTGFDRQHEPMHLLDGIGQLWGSVRDPMPEKAGRSALYEKVGPGLSNYNRYDLRITELATRWLEERGRAPDGRPWLLMVGLVAPHMPLVVPQEYLDLYLGQDLPVPKLLPRDGHVRHPWVERMASHWDHDATFDSDDKRRLAIACYFGLITFLDTQIGRIVAALEKSGLAGDTRIVYSTDHGDNLGTRGLWNKDVLYRESTGIPLLMAGPGIATGVCRTNVGLVDLHPTFLEATGVAADASDPKRAAGPIALRDRRRARRPGARRLQRVPRRRCRERRLHAHARPLEVPPLRRPRARAVRSRGRPRGAARSRRRSGACRGRRRARGGAARDARPRRRRPPRQGRPECPRRVARRPRRRARQGLPR